MQDAETEPTEDPELALLRLELGADAPAASAAGALEPVAVGLGLDASGAARLGVLVTTLVQESRAREALADATGVTVEVHRRPGHVAVAISDRRLPLAAGEGRRSLARRLVGLGFADHLRIGRDGERGNRAEVRVELDQAPPDDAGRPHDGDPSDVPRVDEATAAALVIRRMEPGDAEGLARCIYRCYAYTYLDPMLYRPARVAHALRSGHLRSVVAVAPDGDVVGHIALTFDHPNDPVPEAGKLVVDPRYRGHHLAERLAAARREWAVELGLPGFWSECVTNHPYSQREVIGTGGVEVGVLLGVTPADLEMTGLAATPAARHALVAFYVTVDDASGAPEEALHVPERHAGLLGDLVASAGLSRSVVVTSAAAAHHTSEMSAEVSPGPGTARLAVHRVGADLVERVAGELEDLMAFDVAVTHLDLPLWQPATAAAVEALEPLGFFWGALVPRLRPGGDVLRLQRIGDHPVQTEGITCARAQGERLRDHVLAEWRRVRKV